MLKAFLSRFGLDILSRAFMLGVNIFLARFLSVNDYGIFSYVIALVNIFYIFSELGTNSYVLREVGKKPHILASEWLRIVLLKSFSGIIILVAAFLLSPLIWEGQRLLLLLALVWMLSNSFSDFYQSISNALHDFSLATKLILIYRGIFVLAILGIFWAQKLNLKNIFWVYSLTGLVGIFLSSKIFVKNFQIKFHFPPIKEIINVLKTSWPLGLGGVLTTIYLRLDLILLKWISGNSVAGVYAAGYRFFEIFYIMATSLAVILMPMLSRSSENKGKFQRYLRRSFQFSLIVGLGWILISGFFSRQLITLIYGPRYAGAAAVLLVLALANLFAFLGQISTGALVILHRQKEYVITQMITLISAAISGIILISVCGLLGAALTVLFVQGLNWLLNYLILRRQLNEYAIGN